MQLKTPLAILGIAAFLATGQVSAEGNRYDQPRYYHSEISVAQAYLAMEHSKDFKNIPGLAKPVLVDVRTLREYAGGHPEDAYNIPYPNVTGFNDPNTGKDLVPQDPLKFYWMVYDLVGGDMNHPIMTLCRTGSRSIGAANILANPESNSATKDRGLQPFTNVRNIWEGYVGLNLYAFAGSPTPLPDKTKPLDLNNDDVINADTADIHVQTKDSNPDKDGWRNFAGLPWTTKIQKPLAYERDPGLYKALPLTPVQ